MPSLTVWKKWRALRRVSRRVRSFPRDRRSMDAFLPIGSRNGMASMYPEVGKLSSNMRMRRISSVRRCLLWISSGMVENSSAATLSAAYSVQQRALISALTLSKPSFASSLSIISYASSLANRVWARMDLNSSMFFIVWISPPWT